jgi:endonuclease III
VNKSKIAKEILTRLEREYPDIKCHLEFNSPFELLISTVLAAQCTDDRVNIVMVPLYKTKYKSPKDILKDGISKLTDNIKSITFFNNKAKAILGICDVLINKFKGKIPGNMEDLISMKGVGRKSANVILGNCFNKKDVIITDTHLIRVSKRLGLAENDVPEKIEFELKEIVPEAQQYSFSMRIGEHGRTICKAKKPDCNNCIINFLCPSKII